MTEYRIVCDRRIITREGKVSAEKGVLPLDEEKHFDRLVFDTVESAEWWLSRAIKSYPQHTDWGRDKTHQYNFRIQSREVTEWEDVK